MERAGGWWWTFGLAVAVPALVLGLLGWRAVRAERIEREHQAREQQGQVAGLADAAIGNALAKFESELRKVCPPGLVAMVYDRRGVLSFPGDRVYFAEFGLRPAGFVRPGWTAATRQLIADAESAEARQQLVEAAAAYRKVAASEPKLRAWAELALARVRGGSAADYWTGSDALSPAGVPVALLACAWQPRGPLLREAIGALRAGRWWLSYEERRFHDAELRRALGNQYLEDPRLGELAAIEQAVRRSPPHRRDSATRACERTGGRAFLLLWSPGGEETWTGAAMPDGALAGFLQQVIAPLAGTREAAVRDAKGQTLWGGAAGGYAYALRSVPGWELVFRDSPPAGPQVFLWYGFILLLTLTLVVGLAMTARVVRRELELYRLQSEFLAAVTHEFRSPLASIRLLVERIAAGRLRAPADPSQYCAAIAGEADRLERLVNRILEAQQIQAGRREYSFTPADPAALVETAIERLRPQAEARGIALERITGDEIPQADVDASAIGDAVENLLDNAVKYSPPGQRVTVSVLAAGDELLIEVRDRGAGIDPADLPRIFDRFYRGRRGGRHSVQGTGLGLALVKSAVDAHGGKIEVESAPGAGSCFRLRLPVSQKERAHA